MSYDDEEFQIEVRAVKREIELSLARLENLEDRIKHENRRGKYDNE